MPTSICRHILQRLGQELLGSPQETVDRPSVCPELALALATISGPGSLAGNAVLMGPPLATIEPVVKVELERVEALELLAMTLAHLNVAEALVRDVATTALLMAIRDKLAFALREGT
jgi:hypothetical protein